MSQNEHVIRTPMIPVRNTDNAGPDATVFVDCDQISDGEYSFTSNVDDDISIHICNNKTEKFSNRSGGAHLFRTLMNRTAPDNLYIDFKLPD